MKNKATNELLYTMSQLTRAIALGEVYEIERYTELLHDQTRPKVAKSVTVYAAPADAEIARVSSFEDAFALYQAMKNAGTWVDGTSLMAVWDGGDAFLFENGEWSSL